MLAEPIPARPTVAKRSAGLLAMLPLGAMLLTAALLTEVSLTEVSLAALAVLLAVAYGIRSGSGTSDRA